MKRRFRFGKAVMILVFCTAFVMLFSFIVMRLWNGILPDVLGVKEIISFWQAHGYTGFIKDLIQWLWRLCTIKKNNSKTASGKKCSINGKR